MLYTIYNTTAKGGWDRPVGVIAADSPAAALEEFAARFGIEDYSLDNGRDLSVWLCPRMGRYFYYAYKDRPDELQERADEIAAADALDDAIAEQTGTHPADPLPVEVR